jgi:hypothetical protein
MGNGPSASLGKRRRIERSIAHNDGAAGGKFGAVAARGRDFPGIDARPTGNLHRSEKKLWSQQVAQPREEAAGFGAAGVVGHRLGCDLEQRVAGEVAEACRRGPAGRNSPNCEAGMS